MKLTRPITRPSRTRILVRFFGSEARAVVRSTNEHQVGDATLVSARATVLIPLAVWRPDANRRIHIHHPGIAVDLHSDPHAVKPIARRYVDDPRVG